MKKVKSYLLGWLKWTMLALLCGGIIGPIGSIFAKTLSWGADLRVAYPWIIWLLPVGGLVIVFLYRVTKLPGGGSTNSVFMAVRDNEIMKFVTAPLIFVSTVITQTLGGSAGREGAALQLGGSITGKIGALLKMEEGDCRIMTMCGMSAAFAAVFGTPLAATIFSLEVTSVGIMYYAAMVPCLISACIGSWISSAIFGIRPESFTLLQTMDFAPIAMIRIMLLAALVAVLSIIVCQIFHGAHHLYEKYIVNPYVRVVVGGLLIAVLTTLLGTMDYNGPGSGLIERAMEGGNIAPYAFVLKVLFTALTLGAGFKGGEIVPVFATGATFGYVVAPFLGIPSGFGAAIGMIGLFCGVTNCPVTSILLAVEVFGGESIPLFALACAVSYMLSGYFGLYGEQKIMYSKLHMNYIDKKLG